MYLIVWEYQVKREAVKEFEQVYGPSGDWAQFFSKAHGYLGTELLPDIKRLGRYLTIDRWVSQADYVAFQQTWRSEYEAIDERCEAMTDHEAMIGHFNQLTSEQSTA